MRADIITNVNYLNGIECGNQAKLDRYVKILTIQSKKAN